MLIVDRMLLGGIKFVLGKIAAAVDAELNDDSRLREELLAAQMRLELGEITEEEFARFEAELLPRLREIRSRQGGDAAPRLESGEYKVVGVEATADFEQE
ncbi:MAG: gas vesicle protein GvpG [Deltaproteobacteria bacterium]|nr:MAG: gas vesicle protein GvpG [Deltaproteobacteria bacterium]